MIQQVKSSEINDQERGVEREREKEREREREREIGKSVLFLDSASLCYANRNS